MMVSKLDLAYLGLPLLLWPLSFIILQSAFIYALAASTAILALMSLVFYRKRIVWVRGDRKWVAILFGAAMAFVLYLVFVAGGIASASLGLGSYVSNVYASIYGTQGSGISTIVLLAIIGIFEEIYWRGGIQGYASETQRFAASPWMASTAYYTLVHISTLNPILVVAAFFVGIFTSIVAYKAGILASMATHILWIEAIVVFFPVIV